MHPDMQPPVNPLPPVVWALFAAIMGVEAVLSLGSAGCVLSPIPLCIPGFPARSLPV